jgi:SAM-dependent methyltransferase
MAENGMDNGLTSLRARLCRWFATPLGRQLLQYERRQLQQILPGLFGYHIVQLGRLDDDSLIEASRIGHKMHICIDAEDQTDPHAGLFCLGEALPLSSDSIDVLVLPHVLEFEHSPHQVLRECERVLIGEGHLIVIGFNPWSWWGLWRVLLGWREQPPWTGHYFSMARLQDWLRLLGFELLETHKLFYRPPLTSERFLARLTWMEQLGRWCWPWFGAAYILVAKKRVIPLTPVRELWRHRRRMIASGLAEPTARRNRHD